MQENKNQFQANQAFIWEWFKKNQTQWMLSINSDKRESSEETAPNNGDRVDEQLLKLWSKTMQKLFNLPQIGLTRFYQENVNQAGEKYCQLQGAMGKLSILLSTPFEKACKQLQEQLAQSTNQTSPIDDTKIYYDSWIKNLESNYHELFNTAEYIQTLAQTLETMNAFVGAREAVITDALKTLPIPSNTDMDALYREIYELKKRIKKLERAIADRDFPSCPNPEK
ncbi:MAG: poly(R)-hydroxyalkanoic acid synthase subunit PhaE [Desulfobacteraceae bacterium]|jgi:DNA repair exonuclease SbcCD ATPase subunit